MTNIINNFMELRDDVIVLLIHSGILDLLGIGTTWRVDDTVDFASGTEQPDTDFVGFYRR